MGQRISKKADFFSEIDFDLLYQKQVRPPFIPEGSDVSTKYVSKTLASKDPTRDSSVLPAT